MTNVMVVDGDGAALADELKVIADRLHLNLKFDSVAAPEVLLQEIERSDPQFVLLHHNWQGAKIGDILNEIAQKAPKARLVVFTGQTIKIDELIECVRLGVADYWKKGEFDGETMVRKIAMSIQDSSAAVEKLQLGSGALRKLLAKAEAANKEAIALGKKYDELDARVAALKAAEKREFWKEAIRPFKVALNVAALTACAVVLRRETTLDGWETVGVVGVIAVSVLFLEGAVSRALLKVDRGGMSIQGDK